MHIFKTVQVRKNDQEEKLPKMVHVIIVSPQSQFDLDFDLGLLWVWGWV